MFFKVAMKIAWQNVVAVINAIKKLQKKIQRITTTISKTRSNWKILKALLHLDNFAYFFFSDFKERERRD